MNKKKDRQAIAVKTSGKRSTFKFFDRANLCYMELNTDGTFRTISEEDLRKGMDMVKQDRIVNWEERWRKR